MTETANVVVQADGFVDQKSFVSGMRLLVRVGVGFAIKERLINFAYHRPYDRGRWLCTF